MRQAWLIAGLLALLLGLVPGAAVAALAVHKPGVRVPIIGTSFSLVLPAIFVLKPHYGVLADPRKEASVFGEPTEPGLRPAVDAALHNPLGYLLLKGMGKLGASAADIEIVQRAGAKFLLQSEEKFLPQSRGKISSSQPTRFWTVTPLEQPEVSIVFAQLPSARPMLDRQAVLEAVSSLRPSLEGTKKGGVYVGGLFIATETPFTWTSISSSIKDGSKGAQLTALVPGAAPIDATLELTFPWSTVDFPILSSPSSDADLWSLADSRLKRLDKPVVKEAERTTLAGIDAVRTRATATYSPDIIEYVTWAGGYPVILSLDGTNHELTPDITKIIGEIEASVRPQTQEELAGAQP